MLRIITRPLRIFSITLVSVSSLLSRRTFGYASIPHLRAISIELILLNGLTLLPHCPTGPHRCCELHFHRIRQVGDHSAYLIRTNKMQELSLSRSSKTDCQGNELTHEVVFKCHIADMKTGRLLR